MVPPFYDKGSRGEKALKPKLLKRKAAIQSDGYVVYQQVEQSELYAVVTLYCMAHARRKFEAIKDSSPEAQKVLYYIAVLYMLEARSTSGRLPKQEPQGAQGHP